MTYLFIPTALAHHEGTATPPPDPNPVASDAQVPFLFVALGGVILMAGLFWWQNRK